MRIDRDDRIEDSEDRVRARVRIGVRVRVRVGGAKN